MNWATIRFLLENTVFLLIGLQASRIVTELANSPLSTARIAGFCAAVLAAVIVLRLVCVTMARSLLFRRDTDVGDRAPSFSHSLVVGWAGMRGVVTLAAALLIPPGVEYRETLIFAAMVVTAGTLLLRDSLCRRWYARCIFAARCPRSVALQAAAVLQTASNAAIDELDRIRQPSDTDEAVDLVRSRIAARPDAMWKSSAAGMARNTRRGVSPVAAGHAGDRAGAGLADPIVRNG